LGFGKLMFSKAFCLKFRFSFHKHCEGFWASKRICFLFKKSKFRSAIQPIIVSKNASFLSPLRGLNKNILLYIFSCWFHRKGLTWMLFHVQTLFEKAFMGMFSHISSKNANATRFIWKFKKKEYNCFRNFFHKGFLNFFLVLSRAVGESFVHGNF